MRDSTDFAVMFLNGQYDRNIDRMHEVFPLDQQILLFLFYQRGRLPVQLFLEITATGRGRHGTCVDTFEHDFLDMLEAE